MRVQICVLALLALVAVAYSCPAEDGESATILRNPEDCGSFYICSNGTPYLFECPAGLEFNAKSSVCDWPESAKCFVEKPKPSSKPRPSTTTRRPQKPRELETED